MAAFTDIITATQGQRIFTTSKEYIPGEVSVIRNGITLTNNVHFLALSGLNILLFDDADEGDEIVITSISPNAEPRAVNRNPNFFDKLGFSFDKAKFGDALTVGNMAQMYYEDNPIKLKSWEKDLVRTNDSSGYYKNPTARHLNAISRSVTTIRNVSNQVIRANTPKWTGYGAYGTRTQIPGAQIPANKAKSDDLALLITSSNNLLAAITLFKSHTDRLSGLAISDSDEMDYEKAMSVGTQIANISNAVDGIQDFTPILGSFTSLFIEGDLVKYSNEIDSFDGELGYTIKAEVWSNTNYYTINTGVNIGVLPFTPTDCDNMIKKFDEVTNLLNMRREHDRNYYENCVQALEDYSQLSNFISVPCPPAIILLRDYIGTNKLKNLL